MQPLPQSACPLPGAVPDHQVDDKEADDFLQDSTLQAYMYFHATPGVTATVVQHGADFNKFLPTKPLGGWWLEKTAKPYPGYLSTPVAVKAKHPFDSSLAGLEAMGNNLKPPPGGWPNATAKAAAVRHHLLNSGYDVVILKESGAVVVLDENNYKVVVHNKTAAPHPSPVVHPGPTAVPTPGASNVTYVPAKPGDVTVGMTIKTPGGTGTVSEMKGKAWAKVQGASPAWHKVDTTSLVVEVKAPPPPQWVPAVPGKLKVGDTVKTTQGNATITGFQGKAWASVEANVQGSTPIKKWHPVKELQVPGPAQPGAPAPPTPIAKAPSYVPKTPEQINAEALAKAKADAAVVGPSGHGLEPGVTKIHSTITGKTGTVGFVSSSGFTLNFEDGTVGTGTWQQLGSGVVSVATGKTPIAHPAPPPPHTPVTYVDKYGNPLTTGDPVQYGFEKATVVGAGAVPGTVKLKFALGGVKDVPEASITSSNPNATTTPKSSVAPPKPAWVPAVPGKVGVGTKVLTPNGPGVVTEMQGKAWAAIDGAKPKWQKVATLQVEGIAGPGAPVPKVGGVPPPSSSAPTLGKFAKLQQEAPAGTVFESVSLNKAWADKQAINLEALTSAEKSALKAYTGNSYSVWNSNLRNALGNDARLSPQYKPKFDTIDKAMGKMQTDRPIQVHRGVSMRRNFEDIIGGYWTDDGYMSTSVDPNRAFGGNVKFTIDVPAGTPAVYVYTLSNVKGEKELLLGRGQTLRILSVTRVGGNQRVHAVLVPPDSVPEHVKQRG